MANPRVAVVSRDRDLRLKAARLFDQAPVEWDVALFDSAPADADVVVIAPDVSEPGLELDLERPQAMLDAIAARLAELRKGRLFAVVSAGGGAGCTSVALHLAAFLGGENSVYLEARRSCGGRLRMGLELDGPSWADLDREPGSISRCALPIAGGVRALFASGEGLVNADILELCRTVSDVVLDMGTNGAAGLIADASCVVLVLPPYVPAARRARLLLEAHPDLPWLLVTNRLGPGSEATSAMLGSILGRRITLALPCSPALRDAEDEGRLLGVHASGWSRRVATLARVLQAQ